MTTTLPIRATVLSRVEEAQDIVSFELGAADGAPLPPFSAGSHIDVHIRPGLTRQYSLCNEPSERHRYQIAVLRDPQSRGGSSAIHENVRVGDVLQIGAPRNHFPLVQAPNYLLFAGGIGVTPILCMAERLARLDAAFTLHYCTRSPERTAFRSRIAASGFADKVRFYCGSADAGTGAGAGTGADAVGSAGAVAVAGAAGAGDGARLDLAATLAAAAPDTHLYVCGPGGFIEAVTAAARAQGWSGERIHVEHFGAASLAGAAASAANAVDGANGADEAFEVQVASSGQVVAIPPGRSITAVLEAHGVAIPVSCEQGVCGTCITRVLAGAIDHRDQYFTDEEKAANDQFTPCCSRGRGRLVLDL